jgi:hypothetical protein
VATGLSLYLAAGAAWLWLSALRAPRHASGIRDTIMVPSGISANRELQCCHRAPFPCCGCKSITALRTGWLHVTCWMQTGRD